MGKNSHNRRRSCLLRFVLISRPSRRYPKAFTSSTSFQNIPCGLAMSYLLLCYEAHEVHIAEKGWGRRYSFKNASLHMRSHQDTTQHTRAPSKIFSTIITANHDRSTDLRQIQDAASNIRLPQSRHRHQASTTQCCLSTKHSKTLES